MEEIAALAALGGSAADDQLLEAARRDPRLGPGVAAALGRSRGRQALAYLPRLRSLSLAQGAMVVFLQLASGGEAAVLVPAGAVALREHDAATWSAVLETARVEQLPLAESLLISSVADQPSRLREATYWHLFSEVDREPSAALRQALEVTPEANPELGAEAADATARFAWELVWRKWGRAPREDAAWIALVSGPGPLPIGEEIVNLDKALEALTAAELLALSKRITGAPDVLGARLQERKAFRVVAKAVSHAPRLQRPVQMRTSDPFPRGFRSDLMAVTGCKGGSQVFGAARIRYGRDGRPREVTLIDTGAPGACVKALRPLLMTSRVTTHRLPRPDVPELVILPLDPQAICPERERADARIPPPPGTLFDRYFRVGGNIRAPKKLRNVAPVYPGSAKQERVQGVVILEATLDPSGCVDSVELLQGVDNRLDAAALLAVCGWRYTPTLLNGHPVPVIMTVTVNFKLS